MGRSLKTKMDGPRETTGLARSRAYSIVKDLAANASNTLRRRGIGAKAGSNITCGCLVLARVIRGQTRKCLRFQHSTRRKYSGKVCDCLFVGSPEKEAAYQALAQAQGLSVEQWLTQLVDRAAPVAPLDTPDEDDRPLSAIFSEIWAEMPDEVRARLPSDGADHHDHYIYGTPKKAQ